jgi:(S)-3,5-dihydroxyphenylglycine transaminase
LTGWRLALAEATSCRVLASSPADAPESRLRLGKISLNAALSDPLLDSTNFLNEIAGHYPDAISLAAGAPHEAFFSDIDIPRYTHRFMAYLKADRKFSDAEVRRLLYQYGPSRGQINEIVADVLRNDEGIDVAPEAIVITAGCQEALLIAFLVLCRDRSDLIAVPTPCYTGALGAARLLGREVIGIDSTADGIDLEQLARACDVARAAGARIRMLYISPDFANPSGVTLGLAERRRLLAEAERQDLLIVEDSPYGFTRRPGTELPALKSMDHWGRVLYVGSFAKVCMPGARVGYVVADQIVVNAQDADQFLAAELATAKSMTTLNTSAISQAVIGGMLLEHGCSLAALAEGKARHYQRNMALLLDALHRHVGEAEAAVHEITWNAPGGGFFVRMTLPVAADRQLLDVSAREYGVIWTPMRHFYVNNEGANELRLSCSNLNEETLEEGVLRLSRFLTDPRVRPPARPVADRRLPEPS